MVPTSPPVTEYTMNHMAGKFVLAAGTTLLQSVVAVLISTACRVADGMLGTVSPGSPPGQCNVVLPTGDLVQICEPIQEFIPIALGPHAKCVSWEPSAMRQRVIACHQ